MGKPAARLTDIHACPIHPPNAIIQGSPNVFTDSLPAARVTDKEACTAAIVAGSAGVFINGLPAARLSDPTSHGGKIATGSPDVFIGETKSPPVHPKPVIRKGKKNSPNVSAAAPASAASETAEYTPGEEATKVISDKVEGLSDSLETAWSAMPMVGDDASRAQARDDIWQGTKDMAQGLSDLAGPSIIDVAESAYGAVTGDPEKAAAISDQWDRTKEVYSNIADSAVDGWNEAVQRNGIPGAIEMSAVVIIPELLTTKGVGPAIKAGKLGSKVPDAPDHDDLPAGTPDVESGMMLKEEVVSDNTVSGKGLLSTNLSKDIKSYLSDIQNLTDRKFTPKQLDLLKNDLRTNKYSRLSKDDVEFNRAEFDRKLPKIRKEWEKQTGQNWPKETYTDRNGKVRTRNYDAHHVIENKFGGKAEWWNITPAMRGIEHQGGIHRAGSPAENLFGR
ncbi:Ribonuclease YxiD [Marinomonas gallaica]|uniref:Ribonuclease YxiD n=1 Tax=Marinomonas gallaica TaxID=1806667 RepID=A0A1C3JNV8_9GAMM|nr:PAAR domain-containing protein [Marinomonas gallaica]SBT16760.1 Ribonuclease YxiD [Marinomonas gallaica]SBT20476.1 Ribonuclease YxiD [Marinomonas gallaica]